MALLELSDVSVNYGEIEALRSVSFSIEEGAVAALLGANGAGKSTTLRTISGLAPPRSGTILFDGQSIAALSPRVIVRLGVAHVPEGRRIFPGLSVRENIWLSASRIHSGAHATAAVDEMLERIGLTGAAERLVGQLAHGLRQWVELGIVLSTDPQLILLDEPAAGMTNDEVHKTAELVREINRSRALIVVEHDMQFIRMIARQVTVFNQGSVLVEDSVENILRNPLVRDIYLGKQAVA